MDQEKLEPLDWAAGIELAGGNAELAYDLLHMLLAEAPQLLAQLEQTAQTNSDLQALWDDAHKLHGSTAYCGVPALRSASAALEQAIRSENRAMAHSSIDAVRQALAALAEAAEAQPAP